MPLGSFYFKQKGREALKGNWQTAMVVAFFSGIFLTAMQVLMSLYMPVYAYAVGDQLRFYVGQAPKTAWVALIAVGLAAVLATPALALGCNHYFLQRLRGTELGAAALWSRLPVFGRALWLYLNLGVRILLWSLLLIVPGILAAIRYSMAPYFLADHPEMTAAEAIEESKRVMKGRQAAYFLLRMSFMGWMLASYGLQILLAPMSGILATVAGLFLQVWIGAYLNGAVASFYQTVSQEGGVENAKREIRFRMREMGVDTSAWDELEADEASRREDGPEEDDGTEGDSETECGANASAGGEPQGASAGEGGPGPRQGHQEGDDGA